MANFDNGIPPIDVDVSDIKINRVLIDDTYENLTIVNKINGMLINDTYEELSIVNKINGILIDKIETIGQNFVTML